MYIHMHADTYTHTSHCALTEKTPQNHDSQTSLLFGASSTYLKHTHGNSDLRLLLTQGDGPTSINKSAMQMVGCGEVKSHAYILHPIQEFQCTGVQPSKHFLSSHAEWSPLGELGLYKQHSPSLFPIPKDHRKLPQAPKAFNPSKKLIYETRNQVPPSLIHHQQ